MSFYDLMTMSLGNLWRRKLRTVLTVLGVLIGTTSIVAMLSLAFGMKQMIMDEYASMGSVTQIMISGGGGGYGFLVESDRYLHDADRDKHADVSGYGACQKCPSAAFL